MTSDGWGRDIPDESGPHDEPPSPPASSVAAAVSGRGASSVSTSDLAAVSDQLQREARGVVEVAHRCPCGLPDVVATAPRLPDGTPFPTTFYLTCPRATGAVSTLESTGLMKEMTDRLGSDDELAAAYRAAHEDYLRRRAGLGDVPEIAGTSAGGMPTRVKCLHVLVAHALAAGPGVNPLGDEALALLPDWWANGPCVAAPTRLSDRDSPDTPRESGHSRSPNGPGAPTRLSDHDSPDTPGESGHSRSLSGPGAPTRLSDHDSPDTPGESGHSRSLDGPGDV